jgi:phosphatidylglycerophosphate synthase
VGSIMLFLRYLADCLDGGVARKYDKKSKLGGLLDTISDSVLIFVSILVIFELYGLKFGFLFAFLIMLLNIYVMATIDSLVDHAGMKTSGSFFKNIYAFSVNNSFLLYIAKIIIIYCSLLR